MLLGARQFFQTRKKLPYDAEVEYLESTGTQWIDTGVYLTSRHSVEIDFQLTTVSQSRRGLFGGYNVSRYGGVISPSNAKIEFGYGASNVYYQIEADTSRHHAKQDGNKLYIDGLLEHTFPAATFSSSYAAPMGTFVYTNYSPSLAKYYSFSVHDGGILILDFQPVRFTNELGQSEGAMYDRLGVGGMNPDGSPRADGIYRNRGTGAFLWAEKQ